MSIISVQVRRWESPKIAENTNNLKVGDVVIVETEEGMDFAIVNSEMKEGSPKNDAENPSVKIVRKANLRDLNTIREHEKKSREILKACRLEVKKSGLPMKVVDAGFSFDGGSITFVFIADGRVDFRDLVKNLSKTFQRSVRLFQIGARDETRQGGGYGICGRELCCVKFKGNLPSITSEMAKVQQISHRGSERISGVCGRLMCCLAYEAEQYREILSKLPNVGDEIEIKGAKGKVRDVNALTGEVSARCEDGSIISEKRAGSGKR